MAEETRTKPAKTFDSAYGFSFSIAVGLILFIAGLVISLTLSDGTKIGLIFGIPLLAAFQDFPGPLNAIVALTIATIKATFVVLYFMHVRYSGRLIWLVIAAALFWLGIMFALTISDYSSRDWLPITTS